NAPVGKSYSVVGVQSDCLAVIRNSSVVVALARISVASVEKRLRAPRIKLHRFAGTCDSPVIVTVVDLCFALAHQGRVARSRLCFSLFAPLLLGLRGSEALFLRLLGLRPRFRLGFGLAVLLGLKHSFCFCPALLLGLKSSRQLLLRFLGLAPCCCLSLCLCLPLLLGLRGSEVLSSRLHLLVRLHCPGQRYWYAYRE